MDIDIRSKDVNKIWEIAWYAGRTDRPRDESELVPNEGGLDVHSLYLIDEKTRHRITIRGVKVRLSQPGPQHLAAR